MPPITSDKSLPKPLDGPSKQVKRLKALVAQHLGTKVKHVDRPPIQGIFSRTFIVTTIDNRQLIVQFRIEPLDLNAFAVAKSVLGHYVPDIQILEDIELQDQGAWAYSLSLISGRPWVVGVTGHNAAGRIAVNRSLGRVLSKGYMAPSSEDAVASVIRPHLEAIIASENLNVLQYRKMAQEYLERLEEFARLPLWIAHYDLNEVNVMIDEHCEVTGLIDWELSRPLPFGVGLGCIHTIAGEIHEGDFWTPPEFEEAEGAFWEALYDGMADDVRARLWDLPALVMDAVLLGTLLSDIGFENGEVIFGNVAVRNLPKLLKYRTPAMRGHKPPYAS